MVYNAAQSLVQISSPKSVTEDVISERLKILAKYRDFEQNLMGRIKKRNLLL